MNEVDYFLVTRSLYKDVDFVHSISPSSSEKNLDMAFAYLTGKQVKAAAEMV